MAAALSYIIIRAVIYTFLTLIVILLSNRIEWIISKLIEFVNNAKPVKIVCIFLTQVFLFFIFVCGIANSNIKWIEKILYVLFVINILVFLFILLYWIKDLCKPKKETQSIGEEYLKSKFEKIVDEKITGKEIIEFYRNLESVNINEVCNVLKTFKIKQLIKIKFILKKDEEQRKFKIPWSVIISIFITAFLGVLKLIEKEIDNTKDSLVVILVGVMSFLILSCCEYYIRAYKDEIPIDSDYLILQIDFIIEQEKDKEKKNETKAVAENNESIETEILEIDERDGVLKIKIENKKAPVNNTSAEK
ncbi:hypothetical protein O3822_01095 [Gemella sanguinis]|uniref:hypothetical protein n=1 Tax=Gemella sanguinis TaxID=84135 RepID=UPI00352F8196